MSAPKTILFLGATGGSGFSVLNRSLAAGHTCIALCRTPSKLSDKLAGQDQSKLRIEQGNTLDVDSILSSLPNPANPSALVDSIVFTIGGAFNFSKMNNDDPTVCENSMKTLLAALTKARNERGLTGSPRIVVISTTGISEHGRDIPLAMIPMYHYMLKEPHKDKKKMEDLLIASGEVWTIVRPSLLMDGDEEKEKKKNKVKTIREGMEDPVAHKLESKALGYAISREDVGRWMFENTIQDNSDKWVRKIASISY
ncbi:NAD(P)-binding protein [Thozetella sp. PMI_491]|nr:NAD(P)-binding protein [Thozetella sp. PMI_491]